MHGLYITAVRVDVDGVTLYGVLCARMNKRQVMKLCRVPEKTTTTTKKHLVVKDR